MLSVADLSSPNIGTSLKRFCKEHEGNSEDLSQVYSGTWKVLDVVGNRDKQLISELLRDLILRYSSNTYSNEINNDCIL